MPAAPQPPGMSGETALVPAALTRVRLT
jgi:hypothetical protein